MFNIIFTLFINVSNCNPYNVTYNSIKEHIISTEGYYKNVYKDGIVAGKQNYTIGYGSSAGLGKPFIYHLTNEREAWKIANHYLEKHYNKASAQFPNLNYNQCMAVSLLYYKAGEFIFELPANHPKKQISEKVKQFLLSGQLPSKEVLLPLWLNLKNVYATHKKSRIFEVNLLYK